MERSKEELERRIRDIYANAEDARRFADRILYDALESIISEVTSTPSGSHLAAYEKFGENNIASILFMDIVGYSKLERNDDQREAIELLNRLVNDALRTTGCRLDDVVCLPTGDGMCLCFITPADGPLMVAEEIQVALVEENKSRTREKIQMRMGIHYGIVLRIRDMKGSYNLAGAAINIAQRTMDCGNSGHILCTKKAYEEFVLLKDYKQVLQPIPQPFIVKHDVVLELYNYVRPNHGVGNPDVPQK